MSREEKVAKAMEQVAELQGALQFLARDWHSRQHPAGITFEECTQGACADRRRLLEAMDLERETEAGRQWPCPRCGSKDVTRHPSGERRCNACGLGPDRLVLGGDGVGALQVVVDDSECILVRRGPHHITVTNVDQLVTHLLAAREFVTARDRYAEHGPERHEDGPDPRDQAEDDRAWAHEMEEVEPVEGPLTARQQAEEERGLDL